MARHYYVEKEHETSETSSRLEAARIAAEWIKRGYDVTTVIVEATDQAVVTVESTESSPCSTESASPSPT